MPYARKDTSLSALLKAPLASPGTACDKCHTTAGVRVFTNGNFHPEHAPENSQPMTKEAAQTTRTAFAGATV